MRAHELASALDPEAKDYKLLMAAIKFDLGAAAKVEALSAASTRTFFDLPAPICLFQVDGERSVEFYLAWQDDDGVVWRSFGIDPRIGWWRNDVQFFTEPDGQVAHALRISSNQPIGIYVNDGGKVVHDWDTVEDDAERLMVQRFITVASAIEVFSCCNVAQVEHPPPKFINAKRIAKGKIPFFTYRTLHITGDSEPNAGDAAPTANHASPRLHLRRGHIRSISNGRRIWVRAHLVGDKSKGFAAKDYAVDKAITPPH